MAKDSSDTAQGREGVISIVGPGMTVTGDCEAEGTLRVEGRVKGAIRAGKAVVVGKDGVVEGDIITQDAVIGGRVDGTITAESRLELQATCVVEGEVRARRIKLDEGGRINGNMQIGEAPTTAAAGPAFKRQGEGQAHGQGQAQPGDSGKPKAIAGRGDG